jgi:hypothetical protein
MDQASQDRLAAILKLEPAALSQGDIDFLRARVSYLSEADKARYAEVLNFPSDAQQKDEGEEGTQETANSQTPARGRRK